jgi:threonine dehydrogenase-like Zn-dependent dehydrogenase
VGINSENANIRIGDTAAVFAQGPIGLCATTGARLPGASTIIGWMATTSDRP